jgi:phosphohistidine phosphatase SixA
LLSPACDLSRPPAHKQDDALSDTGKIQAETLAALLADAGIAVIYTSQFQRTKDTAAPLIKALTARGVSVKTRCIPLSESLLANPTDPELLKNYADAVLVDMRSQAAGEIALFVGHDATVPAVIKALKITTDVSIKPDEFDRLFLLILRDAGDPRSPGFFHLPHYAGKS